MSGGEAKFGGIILLIIVVVGGLSAHADQVATFLIIGVVAVIAIGAALYFLAQKTGPKSRY